jgi:hypothetical protein
MTKTIPTELEAILYMPTLKAVFIVAKHRRRLTYESIRQYFPANTRAVIDYLIANKILRKVDDHFNYSYFRGALQQEPIPTQPISPTQGIHVPLVR